MKRLVTRLGLTLASLLFLAGTLTTAELVTATPAHANAILACRQLGTHYPITFGGTPKLTIYGVEGYARCVQPGPPYIDFYQTCVWHSANGQDNWITGTCDTNDGLGYEETFSPVVRGNWYYVVASYYYCTVGCQTNTILSNAILIGD